MQVETLAMINFRNYAYCQLDFSPGFNFFYGKNAQGKTNLLEAVYVLAKATSFKSVQDRELIRFGQRSAYVQGKFRQGGRQKELECKLSMVEKKRFRIDRQEIDRLKDLREQFSMVLFAPEHLELVQGAPALRRRFLDDLLMATKKIYARALSHYKKVLYQRNQLLKKRPRFFRQQLQVFDKQLASAASFLLQMRKEAVDRLNELAGPIHSHLSQKGERLEIRYKSNASLDAEKTLFLLQKAREEDLRLGRTSIGPHRDDLEIFLDQHAARTFASQGQDRTITLSCKLGECRMREEEAGEKPLLLLDDVFSELDGGRMEKLMEVIGVYQSLVTGNSNRFFDLFQGQGQAFLVEDGQITPTRPL